MNHAKTLPSNKAELINAIQRGLAPDFLLFCQHHKPKGSGVDKSCLSQWFDASFQVDGVWYSSAEHYMMAQKALLFGNKKHFKAIIKNPSVKVAKQLGREVKGFESKIWNEHKFDIVVAGNLAKFSQQQSLSTFLLSTGNAVLVEASPSDAVWGIGLSESDKSATNPKEWPGENLLGFALVKVRQQLQG